MRYGEILSSLYDIGACLTAHDFGGAEDYLNNLIDELESEG